MNVSVKDIYFSYTPNQPILAGVSIDVEEGGFHTIVGGSGSGKSTLLRLISGMNVMYPNSDLKGSVLVGGQSSITFVKSREMAFMFQKPTLLPHLTVRDNVAYPLKLSGSFDDDIVDGLIESVGLSEFKSFYPKQLSGGMQTRVALARTFSTKPKILLLDEPFSSLDVRWKSLLYEQLYQLKKKNSTTIIMVTHDIHEAIKLSNSITVFGQKGNVLCDFTLEGQAPRKELNDRDLSVYNKIYNSIMKS